jgi:NADH-quinone oxidoreductase subunit F
MAGILDNLEAGQGRVEDVDRLDQVAGNVLGMTICALGDAAAMPVQSFLKKFREEFVRHAQERRCPYGEHAWGLDQTSRPAVAGDVAY